MHKKWKFIAGLALSVGLWDGPTQAATYVYVSNAEDGTIGMYTMENDGTLKPGAAIEAGKLVMPMNVSPDKRFLYNHRQVRKVAAWSVLRRPQGHGQSDRQRRQGRQGIAGDTDGTQRARDPDRQVQQVCVRASSRHRSGVPVSLQRWDWQAFIEYARDRPDEIQNRSAPPRRLQRQQVRLFAE
jgi:hypothetical protein